MNEPLEHDEYGDEADDELEYETGSDEPREEDEQPAGFGEGDAAIGEDDEGSEEEKNGRSSRFPDTRWDLLNAIRNKEEGWFEALSEVCRNYWYPVYAFFRDDRKRHHEAEDLTQGFFEGVLRRDDFLQLDRAKGNFRAFLSAAARNYACNQTARANTITNGGGKVITGFDERQAKQLYSKERLMVSDDPQALYDLRWARALIAKIHEQLRAEKETQGEGEAFAIMEEFLEPNARQEPVAKAAKKLGKTEGAVRVCVHRLRARFGKLLRIELARLSPKDSSVEDEIRHLLAILAQASNSGGLSWLSEQ